MFITLLKSNTVVQEMNYFIDAFPWVDKKEGSRVVAVYYSNSSSRFDFSPKKKPIASWSWPIFLMVGSQHAGIEIYLEDFESWVVQCDTIVTCSQCSEIIKKFYLRFCTDLLLQQLKSTIFAPLALIQQFLIVSFFSIFRAMWADKLTVDCYNIGLGRIYTYTY